MSRNRVRRSFTVETKNRGRQAPALLAVRAPRKAQPPKPRMDLDVFEAQPRTVQPEARRILPNLIPPPAAEAEPEPVQAVEPPLPRVRRVKPAIRMPEVAKAVVEPVIVSEPAPAAIRRMEPSVPVSPVAKRAARREADGLRLGERWKRRLPRVCW